MRHAAYAKIKPVGLISVTELYQRTIRRRTHSEPETERIFVKLSGATTVTGEKNVY